MLDRETKQYIDDSFKKMYNIFKANNLYSDYVRARKGVLVADNFALEGYTLGRCVFRTMYVRIFNSGTGPVLISVDVDPNGVDARESWNLPTITDAVNMTSGGSDGSFAWSTDFITMDITETILHIGPCVPSASDVENSTATALYYYRGFITNGNMVIAPYKSGNNTSTVNWGTMLSNAGDAVWLKIPFITDK